MSIYQSSQQVTGSDTILPEVVNKIVGHLRRMLFFRRQYDQRRSYFFRQYLGQRDQKLYPDNITPRSNTFVPYPLSNVETIVSRILDAFFSYEDWFECRGRTHTDDDAAEKMEYALTDRLHKAGIIPTFETLVRNIAIYGHAGLKVDWDWDYDYVIYSEPIYAMDQTGQPIVQPSLDINTGQVVLQPMIQGYRPNRKAVPRNRPKLVPIDVYDLLVDPDGGIVAHLTERTLGQMKREQQMSLEASQQDASKQPLYIPESFDKLVQRVTSATSHPDNPDDIVVRLAEVWNEYDQTQTILTYGDDADALKWKDVRASYRSASYSAYKRKMYGGAPVLLYHGEHPFMHKKCPIVHTSFIKVPNELYGLGAIEIISDLTESLNKMVNMVQDNWNLGINRRYAFDVNADVDHDALNNFNVPGGKVGVSGNPKDVIEALPFFTPAPGDYQIIELYRGMIEMTSGVSDFYSKGVGSPTNNKTATGINSVMQESNFRFKMFIRNLEIDVLQPMLAMCASMIQQYISDPIEVQITGENPGIKKWISLTPEELIGTLDFDLIAANYASNRMLRQRNLMALVGMAAQSEVFMPYINAFGTLQELYKAFELRNIDKMLNTPPQVQQLQMQQQQQMIKQMMLEKAMDVEGKALNQQTAPVKSTDQMGRPRTKNPEGPFPGAGLTTHIRSMAQSMGVNGIGGEQTDADDGMGVPDDMGDQ